MRSRDTALCACWIGSHTVVACRSMIRTDNGKEFCGKAIGRLGACQLVCSYARIQPGKPNQECLRRNPSTAGYANKSLNEQLGSQTPCLHAPPRSKRWRREYNQHRPKKAIGAMTPATYAQQLANSEIITPGL
ncbi:IS1404 transposase [Xanthomonas oryzae pv. oryzae KACC 10331]|uniref:IS1404 transposase n=1 Tax=Xanthomonas oryzae pv. oryzae (strain KACC10331 / KXO85) TaxID=291331 RepID=Q5GVT9_XANOR|nr:IS1404 transposase [Xanthomonas oryzae pv. oryzae KACC 10331]